MGSASSTSNSTGRSTTNEPSSDEAFQPYIPSTTVVNTNKPEVSREGSDTGVNEEPAQPKPAESARPANPLQVTEANLNVEKNVAIHQTSEYDITQPSNGETPRLIVRRGDPFDVTFKLSRPYNPEHDKIMIHLETGKVPNIGKNSYLALNVDKGMGRPREWEACVDKSHGNSITVSIRPAPNAIIGKWRLSVHTSFKMPKNPLVLGRNMGRGAGFSSSSWNPENTSSFHRAGGPWATGFAPSIWNPENISVHQPGGISYGGFYPFNGPLPENEKKIEQRYKHPEEIYILFNPWCKNDQVYMKDDILRDEYVLNPNGRIFSGNYKQITYKPWTFGQFEEKVLDCVLYLLSKSTLKDSSKWDAVKIVRAISASVNSNDDKGIIVGNWSGDYDDGISPSAWTGSVDILEKYFKEKKPVKFGQCWVFSGVATTICRALGIPARSVTNFSSAHDTDSNTVINLFYKAELKPNGEENFRALPELNEDSIWNFHVWNEGWMTRHDLENSSSGWQAFDATPQELSDGIYQAGPAPVKAIKEGLVSTNYDTAFIFAEVNADIIQTVIFSEEYIKKSLVTSDIGRFISTNWPAGFVSEYGEEAGFDNRLDITDEYKYLEGTESERAAVRKARTLAKNPPILTDLNEIRDVDFYVDERDNILVGANFDVTLNIKNKSANTRSISGSISVWTMFYTGVRGSMVEKMNFRVNLQPLKREEVVCRVTVDHYLRYLKDQYSFIVEVVGLVEETYQVTAIHDIYRLRRPDLDVTAPSTVKPGDTFEVQVKLKNPLLEPLTQCSWNIESAGLSKPKNIRQGDVLSYDNVEIWIPITARKPGKKLINVSFESKELKDVTGSCEMLVAA